jgi:hypothetical protein
LVGILRMLIGYAGYESRTKSTKKIRHPHQAAENPVETFVRKIALPHIDLMVKAPYRLQRQVAGSGFPNHS